MSNKILLVLVVAVGATAGLFLGINQKLLIPHARDTRVAQLHRPPIQVPTPHRANPEPQPGASRSITLYVASEANDDYVLVPTKARVREATAREALRQLIRFPKERGSHFGTLPPGTRLRGISISDDGTASVNFSREFVENFPGGSRWEAIVVYSVVDTLTQFDSIKRVRFLVEGEPLEDLGGHLDLSEPLSRDTSMMPVQ